MSETTEEVKAQEKGCDEMKLPDLISLLVEAKNDSAQANKVAKEAKERLDNITLSVIDKLDEVGIEGSHNDGHSVNITEEYVPNEIDWDTLLAYVHQNQAFHLLQRRIAVTAWREEQAIYGEYPPGTQPFKQRKLSITKRKSNKKA